MELAVSILHRYDPRWEDIRRDHGALAYEDDETLIATDFEGGNGTGIDRFGGDDFGLVLEPDPGNHRFAGGGYYVCFGVVNKRPSARSIRVRMRTRVHSGESWHDHRHMIVRQGGAWRQLDRGDIRTNREDLEVTVRLGAAGRPDATQFVSNFHWWPGSERDAWLDTLGSRGRVREIGSSHEGRTIRALEIGRTEPDAPTIVVAQTTQPSEMMAAHACRFIAEHLLGDDPAAAQIRARFRVCVVPNTNPDGTARGHGVADARGHFPYFEADLAAQGDPAATAENRALWRYLQEQRPWLFWEWHSNNWFRRPGHVLLRYRSSLAGDPATRSLWDALEQRLLRLPNTFHESFCSFAEGPYQPSMGFQAVTRLGAISCMIKQHERYDLDESRAHAVACLHAATSTWLARPGGR